MDDARALPQSQSVFIIGSTKGGVIEHDPVTIGLDIAKNAFHVHGVDGAVVGDVDVGEEVAVVVVGFTVAVGDEVVVTVVVLEQAGRSNIIKRTTTKPKNANFLLTFPS